MNESLPSLTISDLDLMVKLIDACSARGAFRGTELKDVGTLRERISAFIKSNQKPVESVPDDTSKPQTDSAEEAAPVDSNS